MEALRGYWKGLKAGKPAIIPHELKEYFVNSSKLEPQEKKLQYLTVKDAQRPEVQKSEKYIYMELKKDVKEIETQTQTDIQEYYTILRKLVADIDPHPSITNEKQVNSITKVDSESPAKSSQSPTLALEDCNHSISHSSPILVNPVQQDETDLLHEAHAFKKTRWIYEAHQKRIKSIRQNILQII
ncbi:hypothetical protein HDV06_004250 [Boothiomyces sp. JEL0866]|nr:hypothetical protein HDV06_004250 [Boothiomyces sp. JEL0866]